MLCLSLLIYIEIVVSKTSKCHEVFSFVAARFSAVVNALIRSSSLSATVKKTYQNRSTFGKVIVK